MRLALPALVATSLASAACTSEYHPEYHPQTSYSVSQTVSYPTTTIFQVGGATPALVSGTAVAPAAKEDDPGPAPEPPREGADPSRVLVLDSQQLDRPGEVIGVVDVDVAAETDHDAVIELLRRRAAAMGGDAIVGVEIHHAGGARGRSRASGLAVRFARSRGG